MTEIRLTKVQAILNGVTKNPVAATLLVKQLEELGVTHKEKLPDSLLLTTADTAKLPTIRETILSRILHPHRS